MTRRPVKVVVAGRTDQPSDDGGRHLLVLVVIEVYKHKYIIVHTDKNTKTHPCESCFGGTGPTPLMMAHKAGLLML